MTHAAIYKLKAEVNQKDVSTTKTWKNICALYESLLNEYKPL